MNDESVEPIVTQRAFITDLRLSPAQRNRSHYGPDYHTLGRGISGKKLSSDGYPRVPTTKLSGQWGNEKLPAMPAAVVKKAVHTISLATSQSRIYDELPPRGAHLTRSLTKAVASHEKAPVITFKRMMGIRTEKHWAD
mmetsp:Transcript_31778/g.38403  ORF Transcript_31778/g.38403 Transcript_31778/m.38403 type:complete len:138 (-) Transcript_31778:278-691(-)|eukprot:CAMPEP_0197853100 /NCGR_PEP_ID=MMETSP1438-20131217/22075_1 /TAXON_ID=1461541 /ORGANISM="Pterosperma sp., Strain CCMP1384" /LENGTH=137 /DNA_ID=CAMNT_0043467387 /DNA_START=167 /DNA_END=580 /DNA_ORIENTATION=+